MKNCRNHACGHCTAHVSQRKDYRFTRSRSFRRSFFIEANSAVIISRFAKKTSETGGSKVETTRRTTSRHCRLMRLRSTARGATFLETTHANRDSEGRGVIVKEKNVP